MSQVKEVKNTNLLGSVVKGIQSIPATITKADEALATAYKKVGLVKDVTINIATNNIDREMQQIPNLREGLESVLTKRQQQLIESAAEHEKFTVRMLPFGIIAPTDNASASFMKAAGGVSLMGYVFGGGVSHSEVKLLQAASTSAAVIFMNVASKQLPEIYRKEKSTEGSAISAVEDIIEKSQQAKAYTPEDGQAVMKAVQGAQAAINKISKADLLKNERARSASFSAFSPTAA